MFFQKIESTYVLPVAVVVHAVPVAGEGAAGDRHARPREHGERAGAVLRVVFAAAQHADVVHAEVGDVAGEQAVLERGPAAVQDVHRRAGDLGAVVAEDAVAEQH